MDHITTDTCDSCHRHGPVVVFHQLEVPVLAQCQACDPKAFEATARRDIDEWLSGADNLSR